jgi:hypothetical protein
MSCRPFEHNRTQTKTTYGKEEKSSKRNQTARQKTSSQKNGAQEELEGALQPQARAPQASDDNGRALAQPELQPVKAREVAGEPRLTLGIKWQLGFF